MLEEFSAVTDTAAADLGDQLAVWVHSYNWDRLHEALHGLTPIDRVPVDRQDAAHGCGQRSL